MNDQPPAPASLSASKPARRSERGDGTPRPYPSPDDIIARVHPPLPSENAEFVRIAYEAAERAHAHQKRASGEPYFVHCVETTLLLADLVNDWATLAAGLLHDTIEDCGYTTDSIRALLPDPVAELVDGVTKISSLNFATDHEHQAGNLRKMILAMARDVRVVLIKLCDRLHNMRTLDHLSPERQKAIATATTEIYAPLANRMGMERIGHDLEDLAMRYLQPVMYRQLTGHLGRNVERYQNVIEQMKTELEASVAKSGLSVNVTGRVKHVYSIYQKMLNQSLNLMEINDLIAMRIVTKTVAESYEALGIVHSRWKPVEGRFKDYIAVPKPNGYRSIHTTVHGVERELIEIQIRTEEMHQFASEGVAAHWNYKEAGGSDRSVAEKEADRMGWLRQLVETLSDIRDPEVFMAQVKHDVFDASVFCYTPRGDVIEMPKETTVLDFAFRIHSEVGEHCSGAKINHKMVPLRTTVSTGDIIEVMTANAAHPTQDWLQIAKSGRARNKIRHWLKVHEGDRYRDRGRQILVGELSQRAPDAEPSAVLGDLDSIAGRLSLASGDDVLVEIGFGSLKAGTVISKLDLPTMAPAPKKRKHQPHRDRKQADPDSILVDGMPGALTRLALCCNPKSGDPIRGFVTQGRGISVHHRDCSQLERARSNIANANERVIAVDWARGGARMLNVSIRMICQDRQGLLKDITEAISNLGVGITSTNSQSNLRIGRAVIKMNVLVPNEDMLNTVLNRLSAVPSVRSVTRQVRKT